MKTKSLVLSGLTILLASTLTGCSSSSDSSSKNSDSHVKTSQKNRKSSSSKEVKSGQLAKVGEWQNDMMQGKMKLIKISKINKTYSSNEYDITLKNFKMFEVTPKDNEQKENAASSFGATEELTSPYYEIQIQYSIKNNTDNAVQFNGIKSIVTASGTQMDPSSGLQDQGMGAEVAGNATKDTAVMGLIKTDEKSKLSKLTINFDTFANTTDFSEAAPSLDPVTIEFN
ncbi:hypothetical protein [Companilactobacillus baiquanensis]|uniref:DUF5067 domain-containing protein n=1 Tax=Companilactobacillus baiquanensis TaxID=2486005 RepID=A0ABW1UWW4_9LACO|nr:hypothetical protein [Companilactobacillus baiquanensis]